MDRAFNSKKQSQKWRNRLRYKKLFTESWEYDQKVDSVARKITDRLFPMKKIKTDFDTAEKIAKKEADRKEAARQDATGEKRRFIIKRLKKACLFF